MTRVTAIPDTVVLHVPFRVVKCDGRKEMLLLTLPPGPTSPSSRRCPVQPAGSGCWLRREFATIGDWPSAGGMAPSYLTRMLRLTLLSPDTLESILKGASRAGGDAGASAGVISRGPHRVITSTKNPDGFEPCEYVGGAATHPTPDPARSDEAVRQSRNVTFSD